MLVSICTHCILGEISMKKVKVQRYISGKKPDYAQGASSSEDSDNEDFIEQQRPERRHQTLPQVISKEDEQASDNEDVSFVVLLKLSLCLPIDLINTKL